MTHDPRRAGGQEYAPYAPPVPGSPEAHAVEYALPPVMRAAPQGYQPQPAPAQVDPYAFAQAVAAPPPAPPPVVHARAPAPDAQAAPAADERPVVTFSRAYPAHDVEVRTVRLRKPTTRDLRRCGYPMRNAVNAAGMPVALEELPDVVARYVTALSDPPLPPSTVDQLDLDDFGKCSAVVLGFFLG